MILPSENLNQRSGFTLFETLIGLGVLSLILTVTVTAIRPPSAALRLQQAQTELSQKISKAQLDAIRSGETTVFVTTLRPCISKGTSEILVYLDGSVRASEFCVDDAKITIHPLTGKVTPVPNE